MGFVLFEVWDLGFLRKSGGDEIWDCKYDYDMGFGDLMKWELGNVILKKLRFGNFGKENV